MRMPRFYFPWLQKDTPTGTVDRFPKLTGYESSVPGVYCIGDLTGIPLIKLAAESGYELIEFLHADPAFRADADHNKDDSVYDIVIVGAGPGGMAAAIRARELDYRCLVLESSQSFNTVVNFPKGKPIYVTPEDPPMRSALSFSDGTKESLLEELYTTAGKHDVEIREGETVENITGERGAFEVTTPQGTHHALRIVVAIGKSGNARMLDVPGEKLPKVFTRLIDPGEHHDQDILVVGGGDSALEAAVALAGEHNRVTLSYRRASFSRPKEHNVEALEREIKAGRIQLRLQSTVKEIRDTDIVLQTTEGEQTLTNDAVYALLGTEFPVQFFKRSDIRMEGEKDAAWWIHLVTMISFFVMLYFGKSGVARDVFANTTGIGARLVAYLTAPFNVQLSWSLPGYAWYSALNFWLGWLGSIVFLLSGAAALGALWRKRKNYFGTTWNRIKYTYLTATAILFTGVYFSYLLGRESGWVEEPVIWYSLLYTTTIILFGIRRMMVKPTRYIILQTLTLMGVQTVFLFLLPFVLYDGVLIKLFSTESTFMQQVFPHGKWSSFGLILFWPLNINDFGSSTFWTWFPFVQTFGILLLIVLRWGKGAYCGWICSCGAMAETLGDEYRTLAPHGPTAKRLENMGQIILWCAFGAAGLHFAAGHAPSSPAPIADTIWGLYRLLIDVVFAGVLGLGVYFFLGGRIWCRYGCPLAALMHVYTRFSPYRIMANKKRCISCNICTKVCHMGIDVMGYANKGIPMNDSECVRCSACIVNCPMQVLTFGSVGRPDPDNAVHKEIHIPLARNWTSGLPNDDLEMLLNEEKEKYGEPS